MNAKITAFGAYVPSKVVSNADMEKIVDTSDEWILKRTGIKERRYLTDQESVSDMCEGAVKDLIETSGKSVEDVDYVIVATTTSEIAIPSVASQVQTRCGIKKCGVIDVAAACSGFAYALELAKALVVSNIQKKVLVLGADCLSKVTNFEDRTTCVLFGDGAGAALVEPSEEPGILNCVSGTNGESGEAVYLSAKLDRLNDTDIQNTNKIVQDGRRVFKWAVTTVSNQFNELLKINNLSKEDISYFVPHSANKRIIEAICEQVDFAYEQSLVSVEDFGNTSAASIPLAIWKARKEGKLKNGQKLLLIGFGGGLTFSGTIVNWDCEK